MSDPTSLDDAMDMVSKIHEGHESKMKRYEVLVSTGVVTQSELDELRSMSVIKCRKDAENLIRPFLTGKPTEPLEDLKDLLAAAQSERDKRKIGELQNTIRDLNMELVFNKTLVEHLLNKKVAQKATAPPPSNSSVAATSAVSYAPAMPNTSYQAYSNTNITGAKRGYSAIQTPFVPGPNYQMYPTPNFGVQYPVNMSMQQIQTSTMIQQVPATSIARGAPIPPTTVQAPVKPVAAVPNVTVPPRVNAAPSKSNVPVTAMPTQTLAPPVSVTTNSTVTAKSSSTGIASQPAPAATAADPYQKLKQKVSVLEVPNLSSEEYVISLRYIMKHVISDGNQIEDCKILQGLALVLFRPYCKLVTEAALSMTLGILSVENNKADARLTSFLKCPKPNEKLSGHGPTHILRRLAELVGFKQESEVQLSVLKLLTLMTRRNVTYRAHLRLAGIRMDLAAVCKESSPNSDLQKEAVLLWSHLYPPADPPPKMEVKKTVIDLSADDLPPPPSSSSSSVAAAPVVRSVATPTKTVPTVTAVTTKPVARVSPVNAHSRSSGTSSAAVRAASTGRSSSVTSGSVTSSSASARTASTVSSPSSRNGSDSRSAPVSASKVSTVKKPPKTSKATLNKLIKSPDLVPTLERHYRAIDSSSKDVAISYQFFFDLLDVDFPPMQEIDDLKLLSMLTKKSLTKLSNGELFSVLQCIILILLMAEGSTARTLEVVQLGIVPRCVEILNIYDYQGKGKEESDEIEDLLFTAMRILNNVAKESEELFDLVVQANPLPGVIKFVNHSRLSEYLLYQASNLLMTLSSRLNFCSIPHLDSVLVLLDRQVTSQAATVGNACEIVHNLLLLQSQSNANGLLKTKEVACLMKSGGILEHFTDTLKNSKAGLTVSACCLKALTTAFSVTPPTLKFDFALSHGVLGIVCGHLKPLSSLWKPQGCTVEAVKCLLVLLQDALFEEEVTNEVKDLVKSYALDCSVLEIQQLGRDLAQLLKVDLEEGVVEDEDTSMTV